MGRIKSSRFHIVHSEGNVTHLIPRADRATASASVSTLFANKLPARPTAQIYLTSSPHTLNHALGEVHLTRQMLRIDLISRVPSVEDLEEDLEEDARYENIQRILVLTAQQLMSGQRDHARNEQMLKLYQEIRERLLTHCARNEQPDDQEDVQSDFPLHLDCRLAEHLVNLMYLAAVHHPDESAYSSEWNLVLAAHAGDLRQIVSAAQKKCPLNELHYRRDSRSTGSFNVRAPQTQAGQLRELQDVYGYQVLKQCGPVALCYALYPLQLVAIGLDGTRRDIDLTDLISNETDLPDCHALATVSDASNPWSVSYIAQSGVARELIYDHELMRYRCFIIWR